LGVGETTSILVRAHNGGKLSDDEFKAQMARLRSEVLDHPDFWTIDAERDTILSSFAFNVELRFAIPSKLPSPKFSAFLMPHKPCVEKVSKMTIVDERLNKVIQVA